ncbi:MAG TPA: hypothetical protein VIA06_15505 [Candidatus Dormibacteraeota bacterium]|jgi:hypothetical protein|nr:hypothetical protein [Candidatus Dormibacteraeota bacterium]
MRWEADATPRLTEHSRRGFRDMTVDDVCAEAGASPLEEIEDLTTPSQQALHQLLLYGHEGLPVLDEDGRPWSEP